MPNGKSVSSLTLTNLFESNKKIGTLQIKILKIIYHANESRLLGESAKTGLSVLDSTGHLLTKISPSVGLYGFSAALVGFIHFNCDM